MVGGGEVLMGGDSSRGVGGSDNEDIDMDFTVSRGYISVIEVFWGTDAGDR